MDLMQIKGISKSFSGHQALKDVSIFLKSGEIHAIIGENGAGKSTLMKILAGAEQADSGMFSMQGETIEIESPVQAQSLGIHMIFQECKLVPSLNVMENIFIGKWPTYDFKWFSVINWNKALKETRNMLKYLNFPIDPYAKVSNLSAGERKMVEIAKALSHRPKILILDEATAVLNDQEIEGLFKMLKKSKEIGVSILYVSHRIDEVMEIADIVTIIRDGKVIDTVRIDEIDIKSVIWKIAGKEFVDRYPKIKPPIGRETLRVANISDHGILKNINFSLGKGEILGLTGLSGSGRTAIANVLFGINPISSGDIYINNNQVHIKNPKDAIREKIGYISEKKNDSLIYSLGIPQNISLSYLKGVVTRKIIDKALEKRLAEDYVRRLGIKANNVKEKVKYLSGGNQQKVIIAKWLLTRSKIFIFDEPTKGLDIPSKVEVYNLINELILQGAAILLISSDLNELIGMSDRILVMYKGSIVKELKGKEINEPNIIYAASGGQ